jgi:hypothetical protein
MFLSIQHTTFFAPCLFLRWQKNMYIRNERQSKLLRYYAFCTCYNFNILSPYPFLLQIHFLLDTYVFSFHDYGEFTSIRHFLFVFNSVPGDI